MSDQIKVQGKRGRPEGVRNPDVVAAELKAKMIHSELQIAKLTARKQRIEDELKLVNDKIEAFTAQLKGETSNNDVEFSETATN